MAIADLGKEERLALDELLRGVVGTLHLDLLAQSTTSIQTGATSSDEEIPTSQQSHVGSGSLAAIVTEADFDVIIFSC